MQFMRTLRMTSSIFVLEMVYGTRRARVNAHILDVLVRPQWGNNANLMKPLACRTSIIENLRGDVEAPPPDVSRVSVFLV